MPSVQCGVVLRRFCGTVYLVFAAAGCVFTERSWGARGCSLFSLVGDVRALYGAEGGGLCVGLWARAA